jgi:hypothetical protein
LAQVAALIGGGRNPGACQVRYEKLLARHRKETAALCEPKIATHEPKIATHPGSLIPYAGKESKGEKLAPEDRNPKNNKDRKGEVRRGYVRGMTGSSNPDFKRMLEKPPQPKCTGGCDPW